MNPMGRSLHRVKFALFEIGIILVIVMSTIYFLLREYLFKIQIGITNLVYQKPLKSVNIFHMLLIVAPEAAPESGILGEKGSEALWHRQSVYSQILEQKWPDETFLFKILQKQLRQVVILPEGNYQGNARYILKKRLQLQTLFSQIRIYGIYSVNVRMNQYMKKFERSAANTTLSLVELFTF